MSGSEGAHSNESLPQENDAFLGPAQSAKKQALSGRSQPVLIPTLLIVRKPSGVKGFAKDDPTI